MSRDTLINERLSYPSSPLLKYLYKSPILLYRLGLGCLIGSLFMVMTTTGRRTGLPRRTAIEYHARQGRKYVFVGWTQSDWYKNMLANPLMTIQTAQGTESVRAHRVDDPQERRAAWKVAEDSPSIRMAMRLSGVKITEEQFVEQTDRFVIVTFDPTSEPTPPPLAADLQWVLAVALSALLMLVGRGRGRQACSS